MISTRADLIDQRALGAGGSRFILLGPRIDPALVNPNAGRDLSIR